MDFPELKRVAVAFYKQHNPQKFYVENKQSGIALFQELRSEHMIPMFKLQAQKDKVTRANEASPWIESGFVYLPDEVLTPWVQELLDEVEDFPVGKHDDQVDTLVYAVRALLTDDQSLVPCDLSVPTRKELEATEDYAPVDLDNPWMN
jgi:predicted phage terminase large subunit-like protein